MRKDLLFVICLAVLLISSTVFAQQVSMGYGVMTGGHSDTRDRCVDDGESVEIGYDHSVYDHYFSSTSKFDLNVGGLFTHSQYNTAKRECVGCERYDKRMDTSVNITALLKPTLSVNDFSVYGMAGIGGDWMQMENHQWDSSYTVGVGIDYQITDIISFGVTHRYTEREDSGFYRYISGMFKFRI